MPYGGLGAQPSTLPGAELVPSGPELVGAGLLGAGVAVGATYAAIQALPAVAAAPALGLPVLASPLGLLVAGGLILAYRELIDLGLVNTRPVPVGSPLQSGQQFLFGSGVNVSFILYARFQDSTPGIFACGGGTIDPGSSSGFGPEFEYFTGGVGIEIGENTRTTTFACGTGTPPSNPAKVVVRAVQADGSKVAIFTMPGDGVSYQGWSGTVLREWGQWRLVVGGQSITPQAFTTPEYRPEARPTLPPVPVLPDVNEKLWPDRLLPPVPLLPPPAGDPVALPDPEVEVLPGQVPAPAPGPAPATVPAPAPSRGPAVVPGVSPGPLAPTKVPGPRPVRPTAPQPEPADLPFPQTGPTVVFEPGVVVGLPGEAPQPTVEAIAVEVGRLESKMRVLLERTGQTGPDLTALDAWLRDVLGPRPSGAWELREACPPVGGGSPPDPVVVSWGSSQDALSDVRLRLDAVAALLQVHKDMGQPSCRSPVNRSNVTIHFESD